MQLKVDEKKFDELQAALIAEIIDKVSVKLQEKGVEGLVMEDITGAIAYSLASTLDDTSNIEINGVEVHPYITFRDEEDNLVHSGDTSYIYEFVQRELKNRFDV